MAKKTLQSGLKLTGIAPNILLTHVQNTAPFLFEGKLDVSGKNREYLAKLVFYKKNLTKLKLIDLTEYFHLCLSAHWATAGTFVPTDVDNQIREGLWKHQEIKNHIESMALLTIKAWEWDYEQVTNRKSYNPARAQVMSTHEGTWLSVAIGAYCALVKHKKNELVEKMAEVILAEIDKEEKLLIELREKRDHINFLRSTALMAHNFGDLDRVIDQWGMSDDDPFKKRIYKLGHRLNDNYSPILVYSGMVNKEFLSVENHRHMSMRQPKCLRKSQEFLIPVGPFMDQWGKVLGETKFLSMDEKAEIICALYEGYSRQNMAMGYIRAYRGLIQSFEDIRSFEPFMAYDFYQELKQSKFHELSLIHEEDFLESYRQKLNQFICPVTGLKF